MSFLEPDIPSARRPPAGPSRLLVGLVMVLGLLGGFALYRFVFDRGKAAVEPRAVTARGDLAADEKATIELFKSNSPSVVYITTIAQRRVQRNILEMPQGTGSGFLWDNAGDVVTNFHVVQSIAQGEGYATVTLSDHNAHRAQLVGVAPNYDLAVLRISGVPASQLHPIPIGESSNLQVGQKVFAIGNPFGLDQSLTTGVVSALGRTIPAATGRAIEDVIQTDASINPGNSGGPLLDSAGRLIGINTAIFSPSGTSAGVGFAVPVDTVNRIIPQIIAQGRVMRPYLGIKPLDALSGQLKERLGIEGLLMEVEPDSPADRAGIHGVEQNPDGGWSLGEIIVEVEGKKVTRGDQLFAAQERHKPGDLIRLKLMGRGGATHEVEVKLDPPRQ
jgi:S1-C subfamily serine protease